MCQIIILNVNKRLKTLYIDPYCQYCKYSLACLSIVQNVIICLLSINVQCNLSCEASKIFLKLFMIKMTVMRKPKCRKPNLKIPTESKVMQVLKLCKLAYKPRPYY